MQEMKKKSFVSNYFYNMISEVLTILVPMITTPYVSRVLNATEIGNYGFTSGIVSYFGIAAALGTVNYAKRELAYVQNDAEKRSTVFWEILILRAITTSCAFVLYLGFVHITSSDLKLLYKIQIITVLSWYCDISWLFGGMEDFKVVSMRNTFIKTLGMILIFIFVKNSHDVWKYTAILSGSLLIGNLTAVPYAKKYIIKIPIRSLHISKHMSGILIMFASVVAVQLYTVLDQTMLGRMVNTTEVGYYTQAQKIIRVALTIISSFALVMLPRIATLYKENNKIEMEKYWRISIDYLFMLSLPMMVGCIICADQFVPLFYGPGYEPVSSLLIVLSILFVILGSGQILGTLLTAIDMQKYATIAVSLGAVVNICLNLLLIRRYHAVGAAAASVVAESLVTFIQLLYLKKSFDFSYALGSILRYSVPSLIMAFVIILIKQLPINGWISLIVQVILGVLTYFTILILRKDSMIFDLTGKLMNRFKRGKDR